VNMQEKYHK
jgi:hypothetical protein